MAYQPKSYRKFYEANKRKVEKEFDLEAHKKQGEEIVNHIASQDHLVIVFESVKLTESTGEIPQLMFSRIKGIDEKEALALIKLNILTSETFGGKREFFESNKITSTARWDHELEKWVECSFLDLLGVDHIVKWKEKTNEQN